jgi:DNA-binding GntR family transcriptional regulator
VTSEPSITLGAAHAPLRQAVTDALRNLIVDGVYPPGSRLYEETVASELGVSRNPVREAFQVLNAEGFVEIEPRRGARVASIDARRAGEIFEVRGALEGLVAELAARNGTTESVARLDDILRDGQLAADAGELSQLPRLNTAFHDQLAKMAGNEVLSETLNQLSGIIRWIYAERLEDRVLNSWHEHRKIVEAIAAGDGPAARNRAMAHVASARDAFMTPVAGGGADRQRPDSEAS